MDTHGGPSLKVYILGAGGYGREVLQYIRDLNAAGTEIEAAGFLDDDPDSLRGYADLGIDVVGSLSDERYLRQDCVIAVGAPHLRRQWREAVMAAGGSLVSVVHPTAWFAPSAQLGAGSVVCPLAFIGVHAQLGQNVAVSPRVTVGHDAVIGEDSVLLPHTAISGAARLGQGVLCGTHTTVSPLVSVGDWAQISAGAFANKDVPARALAFGNPARSKVIRPPAHV